MNEWITGSTTNGASVTLFLNAEEIENKLADSSGVFTFRNIALKEGLNVIKVIAENDRGESKDARGVITLDKTDPTLNITKPLEGTVFNNNKRSIVVSSTTESKADVLVNGLQAFVDPDGAFRFTLPVKEGPLVIEVQAEDRAGNVTEKKVNVTVSSD